MKNSRVKPPQRSSNGGFKSQERIKRKSEHSVQVDQKYLPKTPQKGTKSNLRGACLRPELPMASAQAVKAYSHLLTDHEKREIFDYHEVFYLGNSSSKLSFSNFDDEKSDYRLHRGDHIAYRYEIINSSGKGSFGQVCKCYDHKRKELVAVKIVKNKKNLSEQAAIEINILQRIKDGPHIVFMKNYFIFRQHVCIVFELLGQNLYDYLQSNRTLSVTNIKNIGRLVLESLQYIKRKGIIHCDLKPENILFEQDSPDVKLIDFGSACHLNEPIYAYIQSRFYRAPEILLGMRYTMAIDIWSFGCIMYELSTGVPLFPGESELDLMSRIIELLGTPPEFITKDSNRKHMFFDSNGPLIVANRRGQVRRPATRKLEECIRDPSLVDLILKCLEWDPERRITTTKAISHPFFNEKERSAGRTFRSVKSSGNLRSNLA